MKPRVLLVDDDATFVEDLTHHLGSEFEWETLPDGGKLLEAIGATAPDIVLLDIDLPGQADGLELLSRIRRMDPGLPVVMVTRHDSARMAVRALRMGAFDYIEKGTRIDQLAVHIERAIQEATLRRENRMLKETLAQRTGRIVGESPVMRRLFAQIDRVAEATSTVLITGETGTGKGLVAREIHERSPCREGLFVHICCPAIPESLVESELFGHEKGAFTGAVGRRVGKFEMAHRGTLFLDEISEIKLPVQAKLLRALEDRRLSRVGGAREIEIDVRVIAATNRDLETCVSEGTFRQDLYYRLRVIPLHVAPLRERKEDIPLLAEVILDRKGREMNRGSCTLTPAALDRLLAWDWPGNVRELENVLEQSLVFSREDELGEEQFAGFIGTNMSKLNFTEARARAVERFERDYVSLMLRECDGNKSETARRMGISREGLRKLMKRLGTAT